MDRDIIAMKVSDLLLKEENFSPSYALCLEFADKVVKEAKALGVIV